MWAFFMGFAAVIIVMLWLLQIVFIKSYYNAMKTNQIVKVADSIIDEYGKSDFDDTVMKYTQKNNMFVNVMDMQGNDLYSMTEFGGGKGPDHNEKRPPMEFEDIKSRLLASESGKVHFSTGQHDTDRQMLIYGAFIGSGSNRKILYIVSPLDPIDSTAGILKTQLICVTVIVLLLAVALSIIFSGRLAKPINRITVTAGKLAQGNYDVKFESGSYTEIDKLASTLNYATSELSKTEELRRELIANVSHDLRTPLTMVKAYAEMIRDISGDNSVKRQAHVKVIIDEADRLSGLVSDILSLSKIQSGTAQYHMETFDLTKTVREIAQRFNFLVERDKYDIALDCEENLFVSADEMRVEQVIYNLIGNSVNYTGEDKRVFIKLFKKDAKARFEVTDTGKGIAADKIDSIWERYYRDKEAHQRPIVGSGLGLSIVKNILTAHNADFGVESEPGKGSTFWFELETAKR